MDIDGEHITSLIPSEASQGAAFIFNCQNSPTPQHLELRRIENNRALIDKWNGALPTVQSGQGSGMILHCRSRSEVFSC